MSVKYLRNIILCHLRPAEELGLDLEMTSDPERLRYCLRTGGSAVFLVNGSRDGYVGMFSRGGHYVLALSEERDGRIAILDQSYQHQIHLRWLCGVKKQAKTMIFQGLVTSLGCVLEYIVHQL